LAEKTTPVLINAIVALIPESWLIGESPFDDVATHRQAYVDYLLDRITAPRAFVEEAIRARTDLV
ncbi:MAG: aminotransferase class I and II, partial [Dokdonella sp.]